MSIQVVYASSAISPLGSQPTPYSLAFQENIVATTAVHIYARIKHNHIDLQELL